MIKARAVATHVGEAQERIVKGAAEGRLGLCGVCGGLDLAKRWLVWAGWEPGQAGVGSGEGRPSTCHQGGWRSWHCGCQGGWRGRGPCPLEVETEQTQTQQFSSYLERVVLIQRGLRGADCRIFGSFVSGFFCSS